MATDFASSGAAGGSSPPAASICSIPGMSRFIRPVLRKRSRQPRRTSPIGLPAGRVPSPLRLPRDLKCDRNDSLELVHVGHVVNERLRLAGMQETNRWRVSRGEDGGLGQSVEARRRLAEATIGEIRGIPITGVVSPPLPRHAMLSGQHLVQTLDTRTFDSAQLLDGPSLRRRLAETHVVHLAYDFEPGVGIECKARLMKQSIGPRSPWLTGRVEANTGLADPDQQTNPPARRGQPLRVRRAHPAQASGRQVLPPGCACGSRFLSTTTNAPSSTSSCPFSINRIDARSLIGIGRGGGRPGVAGIGLKGLPGAETCDRRHGRDRASHPSWRAATPSTLVRAKQPGGVPKRTARWVVTTSNPRARSAGGFSRRRESHKAHIALPTADRSPSPRLSSICRPSPASIRLRTSRHSMTCRPVDQGTPPPLRIWPSASVRVKSIASTLDQAPRMSMSPQP